MWATSCSRLQFNLCQWRVGESDIVAHGELRRGHCDVCFLEAAANISMTEMRRIAALQYFGRKRAGSLGERGNLNGQSAPPRTFETMMFGWLETQCASGSSLPGGKSGREPPHSHTTRTTQFRFPEWVASKFWSEQLVRCIRDTDFIGLRGRLNA